MARPQSAASNDEGKDGITCQEGQLTTERVADVLKWSAVKHRDLQIWVLDEWLVLAASN